MNKGNSIIGVILITIGALFLVDKYTALNFMNMTMLWPLFVLIPGLMFEIGYFTKKDNPGLLVPGGILTVIGIIFFISTATNWQFSIYMWPMYLMAVAFGLFQLYWFGKKEKVLLIPIGILSFISLSAYLQMITHLSIFRMFRTDFVFPVLLIGIGVLILIGNNKKSGHN